MFVVTAAARDRLSRKLAEKEPTDGQALRFTRREGGWRLRLDRQRPDDLVFDHEGKNILLLDAKVASAMAALLLDVSGADSGARLRLLRLNAERE